jgi:hypothetical protein
MELALPEINQNILEQYQSSIQQILSSYEQEFLNTPGLSAFKALSGVPPHPYEQMKYRLLGENYKDYKPKSISDVKDLLINKYAKTYLKSVHKVFTKTLLTI